jgi:hypothetical protein
MKYPKILGAFALLSILGMEGHSESLLHIYQTNTFAVNSGPISKQWQQFDPTLGTLTGITFEASAGLSGWFDVQNQNTNNNRILVRFSSDRILVAFQEQADVGNPVSVMGTRYQFISTVPNSASTGTYINQGTTTTFSINNGQTMILPIEDFLPFEDYFTGFGTFSTDFSQLFLVQVTGGTFSVNSENVLATGSATLTYTYQVPEPSVASLLIFGLGGLVAVRCVRRKS